MTRTKSPRKRRLKPAKRPLSPEERAAKKPFVPSSAKRATPREVELIRGKGGKQTGGVPGGHFWHVHFHGKRAGRAFIMPVQRKTSPTQGSITVQLNLASRGRSIGTIAFRRACVLSNYNEILAEVRKNNVASRIALQRAGFQPFENSRTGGLVLIWRRSASGG